RSPPTLVVPRRLQTAAGRRARTAGVVDQWLDDPAPRGGWLEGMSRRTAAVCAASLAAVVLTAGGPAAPSQAATVVTGAVFNNPTVDGGHTAIQDRIVSLIDGTPAGARIRMSM